MYMAIKTTSNKAQVQKAIKKREAKLNHSDLVFLHVWCRIKTSNMTQGAVVHYL